MQNFLLSISAAGIWGKAWPILFAILFFGVIIALHEFGHFSTAKLFSIKVNEFSIGMGPAFFKKKKVRKDFFSDLFLARLKGLEPLISRFVAVHSIQLSYRRIFLFAKQLRYNSTYEF